MPAAISAFWRAAAYREFARIERLSAAEVARRLEALNDSDLVPVEERGGYPKERKARDLHVQFKKMPPEEQAQFSEVRWPEAWLSHALPLESASAVADLLRDGLPHNQRPTIRFARAYWLTTQTAPDLPRETRIRVASTLALADEGLLRDADAHLRRVEKAVMGLPIDELPLQIEGDDLEGMLVASWGLGGRYRFDPDTSTWVRTSEQAPTPKPRPGANAKQPARKTVNLSTGNVRIEGDS